MPASRAHQESSSRPADGPRQTFGRGFLLQERYKVILFSLLALTLLSANDVWAQFAAVKGREYREFNNPTNPVRGEAVVGIAYVPDDRATNNRAIRDREIEIWMPGPFNGELSVETATADGRFHGEGAYTGKTPGNTWVKVTLTSSADQPLPGDSTSLALSVRGATRNGRPELFVARWLGHPAGSGGILRLYVNSRRADMFVAGGKCFPVTVSQPLRFDTFCDLPVGSLPKNQGEIVLTRRDQGDELHQKIVVSTDGLN